MAKQIKVKGRDYLQLTIGKELSDVRELAPYHHNFGSYREASSIVRGIPGEHFRAHDTESSYFKFCHSIPNLSTKEILSELERRVGETFSKVDLEVSKFWNT